MTRQAHYWTVTRRYDVTLPYRQQIRSGDTAYEILEATTRADADGKLVLTLSVRMTNYRGYSDNFWDDTFRLSIEEDTYAPSGGLNELVAGDASKIGGRRVCYT